MGSLVNLKTMAPKSFGGIAAENFRSWAKNVRSYCNGHRSGFKRFLKWIEQQKAPIDCRAMQIQWEHPEEASDKLFDFLVLHTTGDARVCVELSEDNGAEAWRQLVARFDPIGESYVIDTMGHLMEVPRCKNLTELPAALAKWERLHNLYFE